MSTVWKNIVLVWEGALRAHVPVCRRRNRCRCDWRSVQGYYKIVPDIPHRTKAGEMDKACDWGDLWSVKDTGKTSCMVQWVVVETHEIELFELDV